MRNKIICLLMFLFILVNLEVISSTDNAGVASISGSWEMISKTGIEAQLTFWTLNGKDKKTELGWLVPENNCNGWGNQYLYYQNGNRIKDDKDTDILLKCESSKCGGQNCYHISLTNAAAINIDDYIKLGENSIISEYQEKSLIFYKFGWGNTSIQLLKEGQVEDDIFVFWEDDEEKWEFGANDTSQDGLNNMTYVLESTDEFVLLNEIKNVYAINSENITYVNYSYNSLRIYNYEESTIYNEKRHWYSFDGVCEEEYSNCFWNLSEDKKSLTLNFVANDYFLTKSITNVSGCGTLNIANEIYILNQSISTLTDCFVIGAENITLDMNGYNITHNDTKEDNGIDNSGNYANLTVKNGYIYDFGTGIYQYGGSYGNFTNLTINAMEQMGEPANGVVYGIYIAGGNNNYISDLDIDLQNLGSGVSGSAEGIYLAVGDNNIIENSDIYLSNTVSSKGVYFGSASNNIIGNMVIETSSEGNAYGTYLESSSNNNLTNIQISQGEESSNNDVYLISSSVNNIFLNVTYNKSTEDVDATSNLTRKWYYQAYVNDTNGNLVSNTNITSYNPVGELDFSVLTNGSGWIEYRQGITEYIINSGTESCCSEVYANKDSYYEVGYYLNKTDNDLNDLFTLSNEYGYYENKVTGQNFNVSIDNLSNALIYYSNNSIAGSSNIQDNDGNINITLTPNNYSYVLDEFNLTEGVTRTKSPLWFSFSTTEEKHIASNLTDTINATIIFNVRSCDIKSITYISDSGISYGTGYSCNNKIVTIGVLNYIDPATSSNVLLISYNNLVGLASTIIRLLIGFLALIVLGSALVGIFIYTKNNFQEVTLLTLMNYFILLLITLFLMVALISYIITDVL